MKLKLFIILSLLLIVGGCNTDKELSNNNINDIEADSDAVVEEVVPAQEVIVKFEDEALERVIREEINKPAGDITSTDMLDVYYLTINEEGVTNLTGLEYAHELRDFTIMREKIDSLSPLKNLNKMERFIVRYSEIDNLPINFSEDVNFYHVSTTGTIIGDITFLKHMTNVEHLTMSDAGIKDITALKNMVKVTQLNLRGNEIEDVSALSEMKMLKELTLQSNNITSIEPLAGLSSLDDLVLSFNPVYNLKPLESLPSLRTLVIHLDSDVRHKIYDQVTLFEQKGINVDHSR